MRMAARRISASRIGVRETPKFSGEFDLVEARAGRIFPGDDAFFDRFEQLFGEVDWRWVHEFGSGKIEFQLFHTKCLTPCPDWYFLYT